MTTFTKEQLQNLLVNQYRYSKKDMKSDEILVAMCGQEKLKATKTDSGNFNITALYEINDFTKSLEMDIEYINENYCFEGTNVDAMAIINAQSKDKIDIKLYVELYNIAKVNGNLLDYFNVPTEIDAMTAATFDKLVLLGYLKEEDDKIKFYPAPIPVESNNFANVKYPNIRFNEIITEEAE